MSFRIQRWFLFALAVGLLISVLYLALMRPESPQHVEAKAVSATALAPQSKSKPGSNNSPTASATKPPRTSPLALRLNAADGTVNEDVETLHGLIGQYFIAIQNRPGRPIGDTRDLVRVLTGSNPLRLTFISADHPAIGPQGHLLDRWGTPYQLHQNSSRSIDVRSAGPDRQLYTADDVVNETAVPRQRGGD